MWMLILLPNYAFAQDAEITGSIVNVRGGPSTQNTVITKVVKGQNVSIISEQNGWCNVKLSNNTVGWISQDLLKKLAVNNTNIQKPLPVPDAKPVPVPVPASKPVPTPIPVPKPVPNPAPTPAKTIVNVAPYAVSVTGSIVNIRQSSDTNSAILTSVKLGENLTVYGKQGEWLNVKLSDGRSGWIAGWLTKEAHSVVTPTGNTLRLPIGNRNLVLTNLDNGLKINLSGVNENDYTLSTTTNQTDLIIKVNNNGVKSAKKSINTWGVKDISIEPSYIYLSFDKPFTFTDSYVRSQLEANITFAKVQAQGINKIKLNASNEKSIVQISAKGNLEYTTSNVGTSKLYVDIPKAELKLSSANELEQAVNYGPIRKVLAKQISSDIVRLEVDLASGAICNVIENDGYLILAGRLGNGSLKGKTIVLDPGHGTIGTGGFSDPGAVGRDLKLREKDVVLGISLKLRDSLVKEGANVIMTRTSDGKYLSLEGRAAIANKSNADVFVSVHANSSTNRAANGSSVYMYAPYSKPNLYNQRNIRKELATDIQNEIVKSAGRKNLGVKEANFSVLRNTQVPSVLVETAFLSNPEEEKLFNTDGFLQKMADGIFNGLKTFFKNN